LAHGNVGAGGGCEVRSAAKRQTVYIYVYHNFCRILPYTCCDAVFGYMVRWLGPAALPSGPGCLCPPMAPWSRAVWLGVKAAHALHCRFVDRLDGIVIACQ
jgi:hypothetical protein